MANPILPHSNKIVQACNRAKVAPMPQKIEFLHVCTLSIVPLSDFHVQLNIEGRRVICPADEFYISLLAALASGREEKLSVLVGGFDG